MQTKRLFRAIISRIPILNRYEIRRRPWTFNGRQTYEKTVSVRLKDTRGLTRIHYACGKNFMSGWLNVDTYRCGNPSEAFECIDLVSRHPFADNSFEYAFAEDFLEHLDQADSLLFLSEVLRTLQPGGVLRLSFPGLEGVLNDHYPRADWRTVNIAKEEAYERYAHKHFYSKEELTLIAHHLGFSAVTYHTYGQSQRQQLKGLDTRQSQKDLNTFAELEKR
jgi:predicted SAM-dependent methyltransferase